MIDRRGIGRNKQNVAETRNGTAVVEISRARNGLIEIAFHHQLSSLSADVVEFHEPVLADLVLHTKTPLLRVSGGESPIQGHRAGKRRKPSTRWKRIVQGEEIRRLGEKETELKVGWIEVE